MINAWDIGIAMRDIYDTMERAILNGVLLGDTAYQIKVLGKDGLPNAIEVDHIDWGIHRSQLTKEVRDNFKVWGYTETPTGYEYTVGGVPVKIKVYDKDYSFLKNYDTVYYGPDEFRIPNSFDKYYKVRGLIR